MKMKTIAFFAAGLVLTAAAQAQKARIQGGINLANVSVTDNGRVDDAKMLSSFQVGIVGDFPLASIFSFQPGILYTGKGSKVQNGTEGNNGYYKQTFNPFYIEVPMNFVVKTPAVGGNRFFAGAGPYLGIGVAGKSKTEGQIGVATYNVERDIRFSDDDPTTLNQEEGSGFNVIKRFDYGLNGTAGIEARSFVLSANYGLGLAKLQSGSNSSADNNNKHRVLSFTLGIKL
jgi:hypothetical protein